MRIASVGVLPCLQDVSIMLEISDDEVKARAASVLIMQPIHHCLYKAMAEFVLAATCETYSLHNV